MSAATSGFRPAPASAPRARRVLSHAAGEVRATLRNGEQLLLTLVIPLGVLVVMARTGAGHDGDGPAVDTAAPGVLALAVISTAFTSQAISTGFERRYGVLKLLGATPLSRADLVAAKTVAVLVVEAGQVVVVTAVAYGLGWRPPLSAWPAAVLLLLVGTYAFTALGLLLAGALRPEATLAVANAVFLVLVVVGGVVVPLSSLPSGLAAVVKWLPSAALGEGLRDVFGGGPFPAAALGLLVLWGAAATWATARTFRWE